MNTVTMATSDGSADSGGMGSGLDSSYNVELYIYDMKKELADTLAGVSWDLPYALWHTGVVAYGREYFFGSSGIESCTPGTTILGEPRRIDELGESQVPYQLFLEYIFGLAESSYKPGTYHIIKKNCNTFTEEVSQFLCGRGIPKEIFSATENIETNLLLDKLGPILNRLKLRDNESKGINFGTGVSTAGTSSPREIRRLSDDQEFDELNSAIDEVRNQSLLLEGQRNSLNEKILKRERKEKRKKEKKKKKAREGSDEKKEKRKRRHSKAAVTFELEKTEETPVRRNSEPALSPSIVVPPTLLFHSPSGHNITGNQPETPTSVSPSDVTMSTPNEANTEVVPPSAEEEASQPVDMEPSEVAPPAAQSSEPVPLPAQTSENVAEGVEAAPTPEREPPIVFKDVVDVSSRQTYQITYQFCSDSSINSSSSTSSLISSSGSSWSEPNDSLSSSSHSTSDTDDTSSSSYNITSSFSSKTNLKCMESYIESIKDNEAVESSIENVENIEIHANVVKNSFIVSDTHISNIPLLNNFESKIVKKEKYLEKDENSNEIGLPNYKKLDSSCVANEIFPSKSIENVSCTHVLTNQNLINHQLTTSLFKYDVHIFPGGIVAENKETISTIDDIEERHHDLNFSEKSQDLTLCTATDSITSKLLLSSNVEEDSDSNCNPDTIQLQGDAYAKQPSISDDSGVSTMHESGNSHHENQTFNDNKATFDALFNNYRITNTNNRSSSLNDIRFQPCVSEENPVSNSTNDNQRIPANYRIGQSVTSDPLFYEPYQNTDRNDPEKMDRQNISRSSSECSLDSAFSFGSSYYTLYLVDPSRPRTPQADLGSSESSSDSLSEFSDPDSFVRFHMWDSTESCSSEPLSTSGSSESTIKYDTSSDSLCSSNRITNKDFSQSCSTKSNKLSLPDAKNFKSFCISIKHPKLSKTRSVSCPTLAWCAFDNNLLVTGNLTYPGGNLQQSESDLIAISNPLSVPQATDCVLRHRSNSLHSPLIMSDIVKETRADFDGFVSACAEMLSNEEQHHMEELRAYVIEDEGSWALGENFNIFFSRVFHDPNIPDAARFHLLRIMSAAALKDDVILMLHQDRKEHTIMNFANKIESLNPELQEALALFFVNMFEHLSPSEWLLYISEWQEGSQHLSNIRVTTKIAVNALLHSNSKVQDYGTALMYNLGTKEVKTVVFDDVAPELAMAILQFFNNNPSEEHIWRTITALAKFATASNEVPMLIKMIGPEPSAFAGMSERIDNVIETVQTRLNRAGF